MEGGDVDDVVESASRRTQGRFQIGERQADLGLEIRRVGATLGSRDDGSPEPDFEAQVRLAFANLEATLRAAGCGFDDIVDVTTFHTDPARQFDTVLAVKDEIFPQAPYPAWTAIGVTWLAGFDFEIKVIARIPR